MSDYQVSVDQTSKAEWSTLLQHFADASIYQTWSYGAVRWGERNLSHLTLWRDGIVVGIAQAAIRKTPLLRAGIAYVPWGPLWRGNQSQRDSGIFRELLRAVMQEYAGRRRLLVRITPNAAADGADEMAAMLTEEGFEQTARNYRTLLVDISPSIDLLRKGLEQKWRNQLNRAEKNGLEVIEGTSDDLYSVFLSLYKALLQRKQFKTFVSVEEFGRIQSTLEEPFKMRVMVCLSDGRPAAGLVGSAIGDRGIYLLGATSDAGMKTKGSYLLQWRFITWLKTRGCRWYDLGGIDPEGNPGVYHFKSGLCGRDVTHIGQFDFARSRLSSVAARLGSYLKQRERGKEVSLS
jgi:lipid II:glycine glycyltransferase (peptidoglycan interpeptide bridge formation enzyme)